MKNLEQMTQFHKGGGGGGAPASQTITSSPPPPTTQSVEVQMAQRDAAKQAAKRKGLQSTILAGETGGFKAAPAAGQTLLSGATGGQKNNLLGGGA